MNIHADDIGLSIVVPGSSYTLWLYATYCYCICGFYTVRARAAAIDHRILFGRCCARRLLEI